MLRQQRGCFALLLTLLYCVVGRMSTMDRVVATAAVVVETTEKTNRYVENIKWYPYYENKDNDGEEQLPRILQAGSYGGSSSSSSSSSSGSGYSSSSSSFSDDDYGSSSSSYECDDNDEDCGGDPLFWLFFILVGVGGYIGYCLFCGENKRRGMGPDKKAGIPPQSEEAFFAMDIGDINDGVGTKEGEGSPFYSGLYHGFYEQGKQRGINARIPVQPFELLFEEINLDTGMTADKYDAPCHQISGKGADLVGPYTLSGKALGNKVSIIKTYYGQGNQVTDIGHKVKMRLIRLGNQQIFDGMYYVNTSEVHTNGIYQIWPVGYDKENNVLPVPPEAPIEEVPSDIENQQPEPLPEVAVAVAVATSISDDTDGIAPVVAVATATAL